MSFSKLKWRVWEKKKKRGVLTLFLFHWRSNQHHTPGVERTTSSTVHNHTLQEALSVKGRVPMHTKASFHNKEKPKSPFWPDLSAVTGQNS